jgi:uncharacterized protein (TIGR03067 family)
MLRLAALVALATAAAAVAAPVPKSIKKSAPTLDGTWEVVEYHSSGRKINSATTIRWVIDGQTLQIERINKGGGAAIRPVNTIAYSLVKPDGGADNALDYTITYNNGVTPPRTNPGIIEADGDTLKFCYTLNGNGERPADCTPAQGNMVYIFKRVDTK